jgi:hypothetical protein
VDIDYEEMWHADKFKVGTQANGLVIPFTFHNGSALSSACSICVRVFLEGLAVVPHSQKDGALASSASQLLEGQFLVITHYPSFS